MHIYVLVLVDGNLAGDLAAVELAVDRLLAPYHVLLPGVEDDLPFGMILTPRVEARIDHYRIGGQFDGIVTGAQVRGAVGGRHHDLVLARNVVPVAELAPGFICHVLVTPDSNWHDGSGNNPDFNRPDPQWPNRLASLLRQHSNCLAVGTDCHILAPTTLFLWYNPCNRTIRTISNYRKRDIEMSNGSSNGSSGKGLLHQIADYGQSVWYDNISRGLIQSGGIQKLIDEGVRGMTSNPSIFEKAMSEGSDYDEAFEELVSDDKSVAEIFTALSVDDIGHAADILYQVYERTNGLDGYISIEVSPELAHNTQGTVAEARSLSAMLDRPNIMIKIPATPEGIPAIRTMTSEGVSVNITLIFGMEQYDAVMEAYISGLEDRLRLGRPVDHIQSVASFFVSRVDTLIDKRLEEIANNEPDKADEARALMGKAAIANARIAYERFEQKFSGPRWEGLKAHGANLQRPLWASTSTKNPNYPDTIYADALIGPNTVDTMPQVTIDAFTDHGHPADRIRESLPEQYRVIERLAALGIDIEEVAEELQTQGVKLFADAFDKLRAALEKKREAIIARQQGDNGKADRKEQQAQDKAEEAQETLAAANR